MTNYEHYKEQIERFARMGQKVAVKKDTNEIISCFDIGLGCDNCLFGGYDSCTQKALAWADDEYINPKVDWYKVAVDTPILVSLDGVEWEKRHFAEYINGHVRAWKDGRTSWVTKSVSDWTYARLAKEE